MVISYSKVIGSFKNAYWTLERVSSFNFIGMSIKVRVGDISWHYIKEELLIEPISFYYSDFFEIYSNTNSENESIS